jgi:8-oxo-dGTP diphosphatase
VVNVACAVITRPDGSFLLGQRAADTVYAGYWEFPGGKVEPGETPRVALVRELREELGIEVTRAHPWIVREFTYTHAAVRLHLFRVLGWQGKIHDHIHAQLAWQQAQQPSVEPMLPANAPVLRALALPDFYGITHAGEIGVEAQLAALDKALRRGLRLVQIREPALDAAAATAFAREAVSRARRLDARVLVNGDPAVAAALGADGVHLNAQRLLGLAARPDLPLVAASCHDAAELAHAARLGLDFVVLGAVKRTVTHPGVVGIGWTRFAQLIENYPLPVFALGGLSRGDREDAWNAGAHGVAAVRDAWDDAPSLTSR